MERMCRDRRDSMWMWSGEGWDGDSRCYASATEEGSQGQSGSGESDWAGPAQVGSTQLLSMTTKKSFAYFIDAIIPCNAAMLRFINSLVHKPNPIVN